MAFLPFSPDFPLRSGRALLGVTWLACLAIPAPSQEPAQAVEASASPAARLEVLLRELAATPAAAWDARVLAMQLAAKQSREAAVRARTEAAAALAGAESKDAAAKASDLRLGSLTAVRETLASLRFRNEGATEAGARLEGLLGELGKLGAEAWDARAAALRDQAAAERAGASALREAAAKALALADEKEAAGKAIDEEHLRLGKLRELLLALGDGAAAMPAGAMAVPAMAGPAMATPAIASPAMAAPAEAPRVSERLVTFNDHVVPILEDNCITCHERGDASGGLDLSSYSAAMIGGGSGRTIKAGQPEASRLYLLVSHQEKPTMPPDEPRIAAESIETLRLWIAQGAPKDQAHAEKLAAERRARAGQVAEQAAAAQRARESVTLVMPEPGRLVQKAVAARAPAIRAIAVAPHAPLVAIAGVGQVLLLRSDDRSELGALPFPHGAVGKLAFSADGARLLAAGGRPGREGTAIVFDVATGGVLGTHAERQDALLAADLSPDGTRFAIGGARKRVAVIEVADGHVVWDASHDDWITELRFSPDGLALAAADRSGRIVVREAPTGRELHTLDGFNGSVDALAFSPDSELLAAGGADRTVRAFRMSDGNAAWNQRVHAEPVTALSWTSATRLLSSGADGRIVHWRQDGTRAGELPRIDEWVYGVAASEDGAHAFAADWRGRVTVIEIAGRKVLAQLAPLSAAQ